MRNNDVIPIWQPLGYSTYRITNAVSAVYNLKAAHTGVLDPLAEGVIVVLLGDERYKKIEYSDCVKGYEFDLTFGFSTDSFDGMGLVTNTDFSNTFNLKELPSILKSFISDDYIQQVPLYSGKKVNGKKLFMFPKEGIDIPILPEKKGKIYKLELTGIKTVPAIHLIEDIIKKIESITIGEFRQKEIINRWKIISDNLSPDLILTTVTIYAETSKGIYVRSLSQDIAKKLNYPGFISRLVRVKNGEFTQQDCISVDSFSSVLH